MHFRDLTEISGGFPVILNMHVGRNCLHGNRRLLGLNRPADDHRQVGTTTGLVACNPKLLSSSSNRRYKRFGSSPNPSLMASAAPRLEFDLAGTLVSLAAAALALPLLAFVACGLSLAIQPPWVVRWAQKHWPNVLFLKSTRAPIVALTIDDGPHKDVTPELLRILKENNSRATWFIIGSNFDECPDLVEQIHSEGHEVGNHTMYDFPSWRLSPEALEAQLLAVDRRLDNYYFKDIDGRQLKWFRPGHGFFTKKMLQITEANGFRTALGSLFPLDTLFTNQGEHIANYVLWRIHSGAIIILHDRGPQKRQTAKALQILLPNLKKCGFSVVTLSELLDLKTDTLKPIGS